MKIAVLGATGPSGLQTVLEALERGFSVVALVRNPDKLTVKDNNLQVNAGLTIISYVILHTGVIVNSKV